MKVGVLSIQGAVGEHLELLNKCSVEGVPVKKPIDFKNLDGLIIPGGESTTISRLARRYGIVEEIQRMAGQGKPVMGTCAGLILMAREVENDESLLNLMDISVRRNAFGRQIDSFEEKIPVKGLAGDPYPCVFIRAPLILNAGPGVEVLATYEDRVIAARQDNLLALSFHPELTSDIRMHQYFLSLAKIMPRA